MRSEGASNGPLLRDLGVKFRRQHPIGRFIVDFYCAEARLVIELDSEAHSEPKQTEQDMERDAWPQARGYRVLRFRNTEVVKRIEEVIEALRAAMAR